MGERLKAEPLTLKGRVQDLDPSAPLSLSGLILKMDFEVRGALPGDGGSLGAGSSLQQALGVWVNGGGRGERCQGEACPIYGSPPAGQARDWRLVRAIWAKAGEKLRYGNPMSRGLPGWGRQKRGSVAAATPPRSPRGQPDSRPSFPFRLLPVPPAPCPVPGSPGGWARGAAGGAAGGSGGLRGGSRACSGAGSRAAATAAARSAPRPPLHQSFKPDWGGAPR